MDPRQLAVGLARFVTENVDQELTGETIAAIIYRLRVVENYTSSDVDVICEAMRALIQKLIALPPVTFAPDVWLPIMTAISEGGIEPQFATMMEPIDISNLALDTENLSDLPSHHLPGAHNCSTKCSEQITSICREHVLSLGLTRRLFAAIWNTDLEEIRRKMTNQEWNDVKIETSTESASQATGLFEKSIFDLFAEMKDHESFAQELYYAALARVLKKLQESPKPSADSEDLSFYESPFQIYDDVIKKTWFYISRDPSVKSNTLLIFEKLLSLAPPNHVLIQKVAEKFTDTCSWLKISGSEVCKTMEERLWKVVGSLVSRLLDLKKSIPYEIEFPTDDFDTICDPVPSTGNKKERFLRYMVDAYCFQTRVTLVLIVEYLQEAKNHEEVVQFMRVYYSELFSSRETLVCHAALEMYKESLSKDSISSEDQLSIISAIIPTPAIASTSYVLECIKDREVAKEIVERVLVRIADDLEDEDEKREGYVNHLHESGDFWSDVAEHADFRILEKTAKQLAHVAYDSPDIRTRVLAMDMFLTILKLKLKGKAEEKASGTICNFEFSCLEISPDTWKGVGNTLVEVNMAKRKEPERVQLLTLEHLTSVNLPMRDLIYVLTQMKYIKSPEGMATHQRFYEKVPGIHGILEEFMSQNRRVELSARMLAEFSRIIAANEKSLIYSLDHENILDWLRELEVLDSPKITDQLVEMCFSMEVWDALLLLQLDCSECNFQDLQTFGRLWKTSVMQSTPEKNQKQLEERMGEMLKEQYEKQGIVMKATREKRFNGAFPNRPKIEPWEDQLILMHNRIGAHLANKKVEEFSDESTQRYKWLLGVCSGQMAYSKEVFTDAKKILARLHPDHEKRQEILYQFGISSLLSGICADSEHKGKLFRQLRQFFMNAYVDTVLHDMSTWKEQDSLERIDKRLGNFIEWFEKSTPEKVEQDQGIHLSVVLRLSFIFHDKKKLAEGELAEHVLMTVRKFVEVVSSRLDALTHWMIPSLQPYYFVAQFSQLFELIFSFPDIVSKNRISIESCFNRIFEQLVSLEYIEALITHKSFVVQTTDKYQSSSLNFNREYEPERSLQNDLYKVPEILALFARFGSEQVQVNCLKAIGEVINTVPHRILENQEVLRGKSRIEKDSQKRLACDVTVLTELIGYLACLHDHLLKQSDPTEDNVLKAFMLLDSDADSSNEHGQRSTVPRHRHDHLDMNFCTYKSTGKEFANQHWYNCYTCSMMDSTGVCSTCAVNCHRGHDLAYSKKGAFFCDCGSQKCSAIEGIEHFPNALNALRGQLPDENGQKTMRKTREVFGYRFEMINFKEKEDLKELRNALELTMKEIEKSKVDIDRIVGIVDEANRNALNVMEKRKEVVESLKISEKFCIDDSEQFMEELDSGHFLQTRRIDLQVQERTTVPKVRELADVIKLDNGTELLVMIPECVQTCLHLHYMDTRTHLIQGMHSLRTETESIPFNARCLHVSGNRLVVCGLYEIYALRFSPQGTVIDRAHIKLAENGNTSSMQNNPVVKAQFCREIEGDKKRKQLVAVATLQYIRIYDLTLHETKFVEEMVLTTGNVQDIAIMEQENGSIRVLVLSTPGYLYEHIITDCTADNNSIFMTNVVNTPGIDANGDGVSLHYSHNFNLVFISSECATFVAPLPEETDNPLGPHFEWKPLNLKHPVHVWRETSGILACLSSEKPELVTYIHPEVGKIRVQVTTVKRPILTFFLMTSSKNQAIYSVLIYPDMPTCEIWETSWQNVHDLWIDDVPSERYRIEMMERKSHPKPLDKDDLVLMAEQCEPLTNVDWTCRDIEMFYTHNDLNHRLSVDSMPLTLVQQTHFTLTARVTNSRQVVRMIRVEVEGVNGPDALKIGQITYSIASRGPKMFDLRLSREESLQMNHREITIEVIPRAGQTTVKLKSLRLFGCDRAQMDEVQPMFERQPVLSLPNRLIYAVIRLSMIQDDMLRMEEIAKNHLSRKFNHPVVTGISTKAIVKSRKNLEELFGIVDGAYLREWKDLISWTDSCGFGEMRSYHVEQLLDRMEAIRTRWTVFEKTLEKEIGSAFRLVELMTDEMRRMPLHRCQMMAQAIVKLVFALLAQESDESEHLIRVLLNIFTDETTFHLANDMRSAVQETISRFEHAVKEETKLIAEKPEGLIRTDNFGISPFYGVSRVLKPSKRAKLIAQMTGTVPLDHPENTKWLQKLITMITDKLTVPISPMISFQQHISDSPSYNLSRVLASCLATCEPKVIGEHFIRMIKLVKYQADMIYPLNETSYSNYSLLRSVELVLFVCLEKRAEEKEKPQKPYTEMLGGVVNELRASGIMETCLKVLEKVIPHWKERGPSTYSRSGEEPNRKVWLPHVPLVSSSANQPNNTALNWPASPEDAYTIACTDLALLIPLHLQELERPKPGSRDEKNDTWIQKLCQMASLSNGCSAYRQCKKLLLGICDNDETKYKLMRDKYKMQDLLQLLVRKYMVVSREVGGHQQLTEIVDLLVSITKLAHVRPDMWRDICSNHTIWLLRLACYTTDVVASQVIELLIVAVRDSSVGGQLSIQLADSIIEAKDGEFIERIIKRFLIGKDEQLRWTMHGMLRSVIQLASRQNQCSIVKKLYHTIYPMAAELGVQGAQITDLIATYAPRVFSSAELVAMAQAEIQTIQRSASFLETQGFGGMYQLMTELGLGWKCMQFDRNPCLVCFTSKGSHEIAKMTSIRADTRYSANTIIYKLISNYEISKVTIKLTEVKRTKVIRRVSLYYSTKSVESVDLKLHPELWRKCAMVSVGDNDTTINLSLAVPVITSSLIVEFDEVAEIKNQTQLHCPRCSGPVRSHSGVCENCGENAFQCGKCRSINYVEREPFLCQSCGFCKHARIELFASCRALPGAQHITCDAERGQCVQEMTQLLTKMETTKTKLAGYKAVCESLYLKTRPLAPFKLHVENRHTAEFFNTNGSMPVEPSVFQSVTAPMNSLASAIKSLHEDLCQQTQQLMSLHEELNRYDHCSEVSVVFHKPQNTAYYSTSDSCFGCLSNQILHSIALLHSASDDENAINLMISNDSLIIEKLGVLAQTYETLREEIEELLTRLMFGRPDVTSRIETLIQNGEVNLSVIVKALGYAADSTWQQKLRLLVKCAIERRDENSCLQALIVLNKYLEATKCVALEERKSIRMSSKKSIVRWLTSDEDWKDCCSMASTSTAPTPPVLSNPFQWISECLFSQWMSVRSAANQLLLSLSRQQFHEPIALLILCENLSKLSSMPAEVCTQFMSSAHSIVDSSVNTKTRLFVCQFHVYLIKRIHEECADLHKRHISIRSDNSFGERLRCFVELLSVLLSGSKVENVLLKAGADDLLIFLLHSTIFLKRMITRRSRAIDSSRMALEKLLRRVSCRDGTKLMGVCVESLKLVKDTSTLGIVVGVMMEIMNPQQETEEAFLIQIEKDVAQEDFLQGRMTHNPYNSADPGMGPLMRDIKNKICRDTEMIALMEDDNGMELLVAGNIISLSLSVRDVYDRLWKRTNGGAPMLIVYRMRGLMGDAVETFIENFGVADGGEEDEEDEQLVKMCECLIQCGGMDKLMDLLSTSTDSSSGRFLLAYLRKMFDRIVKTSIGRKSLVERKMVERMMTVIRTCCADPTNESKVQIGMELYKVMEFVVSDKNVQESLSGIKEEDARWWFEMFERRGNEEGSVTEMHRKTAQIVDQMATNIGNIVLGSDASENVLVEMFPRVLQWSVVDSDAANEPQTPGRHRYSRKDRTILMTEQLATITSNILQSEHGMRLKRKILESGIISTTCDYLMKELPNLFQPTESLEWKIFLAKPSLRLILTMLAGLARGHQPSQQEIAKTTLKLLHRLEQVASDNSIGILAENVIDALNEDEEVKHQISVVREETRKKKKQMAMMNRHKQLTKLGMKVGSGGEVKVSARALHNEPSLEESDSLPCCICRESVIQGARAAGVYAFAAVDQDSGKTGTVSMMVMVHFECHKNAIRGSGGGRAPDEWTRAKLHNAGAKCNVITPIAMGKAAEEVWNQAMNRFETDLGRISGLSHGALNRNFVFVDVCKLIDRFIHKRSFSDQSEGGGRESNMQYLSILHLLAISLPADTELEISAPKDRLVAFLFTELTVDSWNEQRYDMLRASLYDARIWGAEATWQGLRPILLTWAFVDSYFNKVINITGDDRLEWLREHLVDTINKTRSFVEDFDSDVLPCEDVAEFCDVTGAPVPEVSAIFNG